MDMKAFALLMAGQIAGYLIGGIPFGYLVTLARTGKDIRNEGSGNIGATNVGRVLGFRYFVLVFLLDFLKGAAPVLAARLFDVRYLPEVVGFAAILGHVFPIYLGMKGGKGVATAIGVLICLAPWPTVAGLAAWIVLVLATRMVSVGSIGFAATFAGAHFLLSESPLSVEHAALSGVVILVATLVIVRHLGNIRRIFNGTEPRVRLPWNKSASSRESGNEDSRGAGSDT